MRAFCCTVLAVIASCAGCATELKLPDKLRPIVEMVKAAPPEFGAAALERLLESGGIDDQPTRRELIERAFQLGVLAHDPWRVHALPGAPAASTMRARAGELQLDQLSLQMHAVRLMLLLDKRRARDLFLAASKPAPPPLTCDDWVGADLGDFYSTLGLVEEQTFTPEEKRRQDDIHFVAGYLGSIISPVQFQPAIRMVLGLSVRPDQRRALFVQLGGAMAAVPADDRSFPSISATLAPDLPNELLPSFQRFQTSHATAPPCGTTAVADKSWDQASDEKQIAIDQLNLMFPGHGTLASPAQRSTADWQRRLDDFLSELADWRQGPVESDASFYHRKMFVYQGLLDVTSGPPRARLVDELVRFALDSDLQHDAPAEWYLELKTADERVRSGTARGPDMLFGFERSGHPALVLAAALDRVLEK